MSSGRKVEERTAKGNLEYKLNKGKTDFCEKQRKNVEKRYFNVKGERVVTQCV